MRIAIIGSRECPTFPELVRPIYTAVQTIRQGILSKDPECCHKENLVIVSGGAKGADSIAKEYADHVCADFIVFEPYFRASAASGRLTKHDKQHYHVRNDQILANCDAVVAIWDGKSRGTGSVVIKAQKLGLPVEVITI